MARTGRKQLTVQIKEDSFTSLEQIKEKTGLSNAKIIEMLIENYTTANINTNINTNITEETLRKILKEELSGININTNINTKSEKPKQSTNTNINTNINTIGDEDEYVPMITIDETPDFQKKELTAQDFYGKVPEPYTKGPYDDDPMKYIEELDEPTPKPKEKQEEEEYFNPFL